MITSSNISESIPFVSVIIPVLNDREGLKKCLSSLENQTYPKDQYEVIVVDNGSKESIEDIVHCFPHATSIKELRPGSYAARNKGILFAKGSILAFIDSDCVASPDWIEKGVVMLTRNSEPGIIGGKVGFLFHSQENPSAIELFDSHTAFQQKTYIEIAKFSGAGNLFTFRELFDCVGLFNDNLKSGGDYEWGQRVYAQGYPILYAENVCVFHPARRSFRQIYNKYLRVIGGESEIKKKAGYPFQQFLHDLIVDVKTPVYFALRIFKNEKLNLLQKVQVSSLMFLIKFMQGAERIRLRLGGLPKG
ncbi:MAG: glycosyltransferase [Thermodesulfobacteriota bacterium]